MKKGLHHGSVIILAACTLLLSVKMNAQCSFPSLSPSNTISTANNPYSVNAAYLDADAHLDLLIANYNSDNVYVMPGNGDGTFGTTSSFAVGNGPVMAIATGEYNGDNIPDIATANWYAGTFSILLGNGDGTFGTATHTSLGSGSYPRSIASGDLDGNGWTDLVVACERTDNVAIVLRSGSASFASPVFIAAGTNPNFVVITDCNGNGKLDLVISNGDSPSITVHLGNGDGTFAAPISYSVSQKPYCVTTGDFNGDGITDIAAAISVSSKAAVLLGNGSGSFGTPVYYDIGTFPYFIITADINRDDDLDLIVANGQSDNISILLGDGIGSFGTATNIPVGDDPRGIVAADFNEAGGLDLAVSNFGANTVSMFLNTCQLSPIPDIANLPPLVGQCSVTVTTTPTATSSTTGTIYGTTTDPLTYTEQGNYTITWKYDDNQSDPVYQDQLVIVEDNTPPELSITASPAVLWPCNHQMETINISVTVSDNCGTPEVTLVSIESNEPDNGAGDGDTPDDILLADEGTDDVSFQLRAERSGTGSGRVYTITYRATDANGNWVEAQTTVTAPHAMNKKEITKNALATLMALDQNYPNPFNPTTAIEYMIPMDGHVTLRVYDTHGREVACLVDAVKQAGIHRTQFDGSQLQSGMYFYRLRWNGQVITRKMTMLK